MTEVDDDDDEICICIPLLVTEVIDVRFFKVDQPWSDSGQRAGLSEDSPHGQLVADAKGARLQAHSLCLRVAREEGHDKYKDNILEKARGLFDSAAHPGFRRKAKKGGGLDIKYN